MTETQFQDIVQRAAQPPFGVPSQVKTDIAALIAEITRRAGEVPFEPEPGESAAGEDPDVTIARVRGDAARRPAPREPHRTGAKR